MALRKAEPQLDSPGHQSIDRTMKALFALTPVSFFNMAGIAVKASDILRSDTTVNLPEYRADNVCIVRRPHRRDLMAITVDARFFGMETLRAVFREEIEMLKGASFIEEWVKDGETRGEIRGEIRGEERGAATASRKFTRDLLQEKFGTLPDDILRRVENADEPTCHRLAMQTLHIKSLEDLEW